MHNRNVVWIALVALWLGGCGGGDSRGPEPPAPGTVQLIAETPLNAAWYAANRVSNGRFQRWPLGQNIPDDFEAPDPRYSLVANAGGPARQTWRQSDVLNAPGTLFRTRVTLRNGVDYRIMALAETDGDGVASMSLWRVPSDGNPEMVDPTLLTLLPGQGLLKKYARTFSVPEDGTYILASQAIVEPDGSFITTWHRWQLIVESENAP